MANKVILLLIDGLRADAVAACENPYTERLRRESTYTLAARTVTPSVTLPCHMSLFHSVDPQRHGVMTNVFTPMARPLPGLIEQLYAAGKRCAFFYGYEPLRDLCRPEQLAWSLMIDPRWYDVHADAMIADAAIRYIGEASPDFVFLYMGDTDNHGHDSGWMSEDYLATARNAFDCVRRVRESVPGDYNLIVTADHGGHDRSHGTELPEDMTIPLFMSGPAFERGREIAGASIKDLAPTIAALTGAAPARAWEGRSLL